MEPNHRHDPVITDLARYWDAATAGRPAAIDHLDPTLVETVRRLHARDDVPEIDPAFATRLADKLEAQMQRMHQSRAQADGPLAATPPPSLRSFLPRAPALNKQAGVSGASSFRVPVSHLVSAALVTVTLLVAFLVVGRWGAPTHGGEDGRLVAAPSVIVATPSSASSQDDTLVKVTLPAGALPAEITGGLNYYTVVAGSEATWDWTCCSGVRLDYIVQGTYTVTGSGAVQVMRSGANGVWEDIAPNTELVLAPGDALLSRLEDGFTATNVGTTPIELIDAVLFTGSPLDDPVPYEASGRVAWQVIDQDIWGLPVAVPGEPVILRLRDTTIDATSQLDPPQGALLQFAVSTDEGAVPSTQDEFVVKNAALVPIAVYALSLEPGSSTAATPATAP